MYNFDFLDSIMNKDVLLLFHNETEDVENNIIKSIASRISSDLLNMYPERNIEESLVILQYPSANSPSHIFNQFFDSPRCASMMFSSFKGVFVVDCSEYTSFDGVPMDNLIEYIKDNASSDFKFIVLMSQKYRNMASVHIDKAHMRNASFVDLEINESCLDEFRKNINAEICNCLDEQYKKNNKFRQLSPHQILECVLRTVKDEKDLSNELSITISGNYGERRIGF